MPWRPELGRRGLLQASAALAVAQPDVPVPVRASARPGSGRFMADEFGTVGVFGLEWLLEPRFTRLLDHIAASPGAVRGIRAFGVLNGGLDKTFPTLNGAIWDDPDRPMDFSRSLAALEAMVSRGLVPFLPLTFFPPAVSPKPITPPASWERWQALVRGFLDAVVGRFGAAEVARWWFEGWNEPNMPPFWGGDFDQYLALYRATSEAITASGHRVRLGGPVLAYMPDGGEALMERFLTFLRANPAVKCDFVSLHRKGIWVTEEIEPELSRLVDSAEVTARAVRRLLPERARGMPVVNDEADMRVVFDQPYRPRVTEQFPSWLAAVAIAHDAMSAASPEGMRFLAASDNANQQLPRGPFDGRRALMTPVSTPEDLVKLPVMNFYELLRLMGEQRAAPAEGLPPGVAHLLTSGPHGIAALFTRFEPAGEVRLDYVLRDIPWQQANLVQFCIDATHSNATTLADKGADPAAMRLAAELGVEAPLRSNLAVTRGELRVPVRIAAFGTVLLWVTPHRPAPPATPRWIEARREGGNVVLRWTPDAAPDFYSFELTRDGSRISPEPLRAAMWIDTAPPPGPHRYGVRAMSASGIWSDAAAQELG
ncbi:MAG TPA: hypothetical protein VGC80_15930 [Acetobacteraceae bacterium]